MTSDGSETSQVITEFDAGILSVRLNRPKKKNAMTHAMYSALLDALDRVASDDEVRVLFICGEGGSFCAGNDVADFLTASGEGDSHPAVRFIRALPGIPKPVVAAVNGAAVGIGTTMLLHFDLVYAAEGARFKLPFVTLGLCPEAASSYLLPRLAGHQRAAEMLMLCEAFDAETARDIGIVTGVCPPDELFDTAMAKARALAEQAPGSLRATRELMRRGTTEVLNEVIEAELALLGERLRSPETAEAVQAFIQRRKPDYSNLT